MDTIPVIYLDGSRVGPHFGKGDFLPDGTPSLDTSKLPWGGEWNPQASLVVDTYLGPLLLSTVWWSGTIPSRHIQRTRQGKLTLLGTPAWEWTRIRLVEHCSERTAVRLMRLMVVDSDAD